MSRSPVDFISVESVDGDLAFAMDQITSFEARRSITSPSEVSMEIGDDGSFLALKELTALGQKFRITLNDRPLLQGRVEMRDSPLDAGQGSVLRFVVRTFLTDALYASADPKVRIKDVSIKQFILAVYAPLGLVERDFVFDARASRDLLTGKTTRGGAAPPDLEALKEDQAKIRPPETIFQAADRHLRRHGLMHWDTSDGRIVVAAPDENQDPIYYLRSFRGPNGSPNNVLRMQRVEDVSDAASSVAVFGWGGARDYQKAKVQFLADETRVLDAGFYRPVVIVDEGVKTLALAQRRATQERSRRARKIDSYRAEMDGLAFDDGSARLPYEIDTVADVITDTHGGSVGRYFVEEVAFHRTPRGGDTTSLTLVGPGSWVL